MGTVELNTPEFGRLGGMSALDFVYWLMTEVESAYPRTTAAPNFVGAVEDEEACVQMVVFAVEQTGIEPADTFDGLLSDIQEFSTTIDVAEAFHTRGALLFKNRGCVVALGDYRRIIEIADDVCNLRYLNDDELVSTYWDFAAKVPWMRYA